MNIIIFGPPGAGKGTQAEKLAKNNNLYNISTGDLLRREIDKSTDLGKKIKSIIDDGRLVSDELINDLIEQTLSNKKFFNKLIFDGYPRNLNQAINFDSLLKKYKQKISCVLSLEVDKNTIIKRISGRQVCTKCGLTFNTYYNPSDKKNHNCDKKFLVIRSDDKEATISKRHDTYIALTLPILDYYGKQKLLREINGMAKIEEIYEQIQAIIASLETWLYILYLYK